MAILMSNACDMACQVVELTDVARQFLDARFSDFDRDRDGVLSQAELDEVYSTSPSRSAPLSSQPQQLATLPPPHPHAVMQCSLVSCRVMQPRAVHLPKVPLGRRFSGPGLVITTIAQPVQTS